VKSALEHSWYAGMRFKMAFETEDSSRISWFMGTIATVQPADPVLWPNSPWRVLQVAWDDPDLLQGVSRVSPWQVKLLATFPMQLPPFSLPKKKLRAALPQELQLQAPGLLGLPLASTSHGLPAMPWRSSSALVDDSSAGMQGARHDHFNGLPAVDFRSCNYKRPREFNQENHQLFHPQTEDSHTANTNLHNYFSPLPRRPDVPVPSIQSPAFMSASVSAQLEPPVKKTSAAATSFFLFGQFIDPSCASKSQERPNGQQVMETRNASSENDKARDSSRGNMLKWLHANDEGATTSPQFKVSMEGDDVGRTLELSLFNTYDELYSRLGAMFSVSQLQDCVVYRDVRGSIRRIGDEPFRSFVQTGRHLTILQQGFDRKTAEERS